MAHRLALGTLAMATCLWVPPSARPASWIDVPYVKQQDNGCGAAATAMIMQYWRAQGFAVPEQSADPAVIYRHLYSEHAKATLGSDIERYLRGHGLQSHVFKGEWDDLAGHVERGRPLIVCIRNKGRGAPFHYVVVVGDVDGAVLVNDPARRKLSRIDRKSFEAAWEAAGRWTLLAVPQEPR